MVLLTDNVEKRPLPPGDGAPRGPFEGPLAAQPRFLALLYHIIHSKSIGVRHSTVLTAKKHWKKAVLPGAAGRQQAALADGFRTAACFCGVQTCAGDLLRRAEDACGQALCLPVGAAGLPLGTDQPLAVGLRPVTGSREARKSGGDRP